MDTVRHGVALLLIVTLPPALLFWFSIHPFIGFWRRRSTALTYTLHAAGGIAVGYAIYRLRGPLLETDYGTRWPLVALAGALQVASTVIDLRRRRQLGNRVLVGLPELKADSEGPGVLLQEGIYAHIRHPRYLAFFLAAAAWACFANYLATWVLLTALVPALWLLVIVEERELSDRFGEAYVRYAQRVPRYFPWSRPAN